jgi:hypothetical protein
MNMSWLVAWDKEREEREEANAQQREKSTAMNKGVCDDVKQELA